MVVVSNSTLRQNVYENIYDILTSANLASGRATVVAAYKDSMTSFPIVAINPVNVSFDSVTFDRSVSFKEIVVTIDIYTKANKDLDIISDEILSVLQAYKMGGVMLNGWQESTAFSTPNNNKVHLKSIVLSYKRV